MMKKQLLGVFLVGILSGSAHAARSSEGVLGLVIGGSAVSAGAGYAAHKIIKGFQGDSLRQTSKTAVFGSVAIALGAGALAVQKYLETYNVKDSFRNPAKFAALIIGAITFAGLEYNS